MTQTSTPDCFGRTREELGELLSGEFGVREKYRAEQIYLGFYARRARSFEEIKELPRALTVALEGRYTIPSLVTEHCSSASDGTKKFLFRLPDGRQIETVLIPSEMRDDTGNHRRKTLCVSTQVGCPLDCKFCATASLKVKRNLTTGEILLQLFEVERAAGEPVTNLVFMGMGEPMLNYDNVVRALRILTDPTLHLLGKRRITVSTSGIPDEIRALAREGLDVKLALSLHATTNGLRTRLMPINKRYPLEEVLAAVEEYYQITRVPITYEYILFQGLNDTELDAKRLAKIARRVPSKINVIPFHPIDFTDPTGFSATLKPATNEEFNLFLATLKHEGAQVMVRSSSGKDIEAACGQLALSELKKSSRPLDIALPHAVNAE